MKARRRVRGPGFQRRHDRLWRTGPLPLARDSRRAREGAESLAARRPARATTPPGLIASTRESSKFDFGDVE